MFLRTHFCCPEAIHFLIHCFWSETRVVIGSANPTQLRTILFPLKLFLNNVVHSSIIDNSSKFWSTYLFGAMSDCEQVLLLNFAHILHGFFFILVHFFKYSSKCSCTLGELIRFYINVKSRELLSHFVIKFIMLNMTEWILGCLILIKFCRKLVFTCPDILKKTI